MDNRFAQLSALFEALRELDESARAHRLEQARREDPELYAEVLELLAEHDDEQAFGVSTAVDPVATSEQLSDASQHPKAIGPYKILGVLGEGGMGAVFAAEQTEPVRRRVALKLIKLGMDSRQVVARFEAERQALAMMNHDNIARVFDCGTTERGQPYFVMELVKGTPLTTHCDRHKLDTRGRLELFRQVCAGVQHAHQKGVIHRDLKPNNILVSVDQGHPVPKIIDFGLARATDHELTQRTLYTEQGQVLGTPEYMSPEQVEMSSQDIDTRTDVYSLGVILYELLVGVLPFTRQDCDAGLVEILNRIRDTDPPKPSTRLSSLGDESSSHAARRRTTLPSLRKQLRGDLDWIVMMAMEKDRNRRYGTPNELANDLGRFLADEPVHASPPSFGYRAKKLLRRYRAPAAAIGLLILTLAGGVISTTVFAVRSARSEAALRERQKELEATAYAAHLRQVEERIRTARYAGLATTIHEAPADPRTGSVDANERVDVAWHWLRSRAVLPRLQVLIDGTDVGDVEFSPDGQKLLYRFAEGNKITLRVCRLSDAGELVQELEVDEPVSDAEFGPDGSWILTGSAVNGQVARWDATSGKELARAAYVRRRPTAVSAVAVSPSGNLIAYGGVKGVGIANADDLVADRKIRSDEVRTLDFSPDSKRILIGLRDGTLQICSVATGERLHEILFSRAGRGVRAASFSPDGTLVLATGGGGRVALFSASDGRLVRDLAPHQQGMNDNWVGQAARFSSDGRWAITAGRDHLVRVHSIATGEAVGAFGADGVNSLAIDDANGRVLAGSIYGMAIGRLPDLPLPLVLRNAVDNLSVVVSPDGRTAFSVVGDDRAPAALAKWDLATGARTLKVGLPWNMQPRSVALHENRVVVVGENGPGWLLDAETGACIAKLEPPGDVLAEPTPGLVRARFSPDGKTIAIAVGTWSFRKNAWNELPMPILLFDGNTGVYRDRLVAHKKTVTEVVFSPDGKRMASMGRGGNMVLWKRDADGATTELKRFRGDSLALAFDPRSERLYWGIGDGRIASVDAHNGGAPEAYPFRHDVLRDLRFTEDGTRLMIGTTTSASLWDVPPKNRLVTLSEHERAGRAADLGPGNTGAPRGVLLSGQVSLTYRETAARPALFATRRAVLAAARSTTLRQKETTLDAAPDLDPTLRRRLLARPLNRAAWPVVKRRNATKAEYEAAAEHARLAVAGSVPGSFLEALTRNTLGVALYRLGKHEEAIAELEASAALVPKHPHNSADGIASTQAVLAMANHALGRAVLAREHLERAWQTWFLNHSGFVDDDDVAATREAIEVLGVEPLRGNGPQYSAAAVVGPPDVRLWHPTRSGNLDGEWLEVRYATAQRIDKVRVYVGFWPGRITEIRAIDEAGPARRIWKATDPMDGAGIFEVPVQVDAPVRTLRILFDTSGIEGGDKGIIETVEIVGKDGRQWPAAARASS